MPRGLLNWTFKDVENFLKAKKFSLNYSNGSHYYYVGVYAGSLRNVCVPFHGNKSIKPRTIKGIILQSGIDKKEWFKKDK
jgi:predicted RNA binding protein YcfA (HicA-like mRNA interferase family)